MHMVLCGKCAAMMSETHKVKTMGKAVKDTCQSCGRRRYCAPRDVEIRSKMVAGDAQAVR